MTAVSPTSEAFGDIVTFYSYKGGTGRSMALANVAYVLATRWLSGPGETVLMIDWDLEAPGLEKYFRSGVGAMKPLSGDTVRGGLIDYMTDIARYYRDADPNGEAPESMARTEHAQRLFDSAWRSFPFDDHIVTFDGAPGLRLLRAGDTRTPGATEGYWEKVRNFDWEQFYRRHGSFLTLFRERLSLAYRFTLIDSRTGLTDIGGICTRVMPNKLVAVFAPNHQNIDGICRVARRAVEYRYDSRDPRGLMVFPVASRIDASASKLRTTWRHGGSLDDDAIEGYEPVFEALFRDLYHEESCSLRVHFDATQIPHDSDYAYGELVAAIRDGTSDSLSIGNKCAELARRLATFVAPWESDEVDVVAPAPVPLRYRTGGSLTSEDLYVIRPADAELQERALRGEPCLILGERLVGKTSLLHRLHANVRGKGVTFAMCDLVAARTNDVHAWFQGVVDSLVRSLDLDLALLTWWHKHPAQPTQRFTAFVREQILPRFSQRLVIAFDEIDSASPAQREELIQVVSALKPERDRVGFVLCGALGLTELPALAAATSIELRDFTLEQALILGQGFERCVESVSAVMRDVLAWTGGHPYLTHRVCCKLADALNPLDDKHVEAAVALLFLKDAGPYRDPLLSYVDAYLTSLPPALRRSTLELYRKVLRHSRQTATDLSPEEVVLRRIGLLKATREPERTTSHGIYLSVRNKIYKNAFNESWVEQRMPPITATLSRSNVFAFALLLAALALLLALFRPLW